MAKDKDNTEDADDDSKKLILKLDQDDSALVVRTDGSIELISRELQGKDENYVGDMEDLNRTFTLVLAFAAAIENERLYNDIFQNLNHVLQRQWSKLPEDEKLRIENIRSKSMKDKSRNKEEWLNKWRDEIERGRKSLEDYMNLNPDEREGPFGPEARPEDFMETRKRPKKKKVNPLNKMKNINWNPNDKSLTAHFKDFRADAAPDEED
tara:strand:+ start:26 stop:652 length:627 start_codon:yes stop_codon:yes gene_type:complete